jgi:hypothetical protein
MSIISSCGSKSSEKSVSNVCGFRDKFLPTFEGTNQEWMERPTGKMLTGKFGKMSLYGLGYPCVGGIFDPPEIEVDPSSNTSRVTCKNFTVRTDEQQTQYFS